MLQGVLGWVFVGIFFSATIGKCYHPQNPSVVLEQSCVHQNRFIIESFRFLVPMFSKVSEMRFLVRKGLDPMLFYVYGHEMI